MWAAVLAFFTIDAFSEENGKKILTTEQKTKLTETFGEAFVQTLEASFTESPDGTAASNAAHAIELEALRTALQTAETDREALRNDVTALNSEKVANAKKITDLQSAITVLSQKPEDDPTPSSEGINKNQKLDVMNSKHLFGIQQPFMAIDEAHPYNLRAYSALMARKGVSIPVPMATSSMDYSALATLVIITG